MCLAHDYSLYILEYIIFLLKSFFESATCSMQNEAFYSTNTTLPSW